MTPLLKFTGNKMAANTKEEFIDYCLRKLGAPVIEINVSPSQVEDRVDEAIQFWQDYHFDGSNMIYLKHIVTQDDVENGYISVPENLLGVTRILDTSYLGMTGNPLDFGFQFISSQLMNLSNMKMSEYYMSRQHLSLIREVLIGRPSIRFNRHKNRVHIDNSDFSVNRVFVFEAWDPTVSDDMWDDRWLKKYATALIGVQWGKNLSKFQNVQLMSGMMFNGDQILQLYKDEVKELEEELTTSFGPGYSYYMG